MGGDILWIVVWQKDTEDKSWGKAVAFDEVTSLFW